ncbi:tail fiber protein [Roseibium sp.]|uniref:phage tail protein n=1 Tax=Roseibium sp. TaxID=1936156 RepID=UPI003263ECAE
MSEPFLAEVRMVGFNFPPRGWAFTDGQILPINQNQSLYSLLGTTYGGDGRTSFALPDLRSRTPIHKGDGYTLGQKGGAETVTLVAAQIAAHTHTVKAVSVAGNDRSPEGTLFAAEVGADLPYREPQAASTTALRSGTVTNAGGGQAHNNMQPYQTLNFCIALQGLFPSRN